MKTTIAILAALLLAPAAARAEPTDATGTAAAAPTTETHEPGTILLAPKIGFFEPTSKLGGAFFGALEVGAVTPLLNHALAVVLEGDYYQPALKTSLTDPQLKLGSGVTNDVNLDEREIGFLLSFVYRADMGAFTPYGGLGPALYLHKASASAFGTTNTETEGKLGFQALAGAEYALGGLGGLFLEFHYHFTNVDFTTTGNANVGGFLAAGVGYRFRF